MKPELPASGLHTHKALPHLSSEHPWIFCVGGAKCAADSARQKAHGGRLIVDTCLCGATRKAERNIGAINYGEWIEAAK